jgi:CDP-glucose 4,6-dehydratase
VDYFNHKRVLITGHTGFKGTWLSRILIRRGAIVLGYALEPSTEPSLFKLVGLDSQMESMEGDIRDYVKLSKVFKSFKPEFVLHLAAQPIVRESYRLPRYTYETNVMGTVNLLECIRMCSSVRSVLNVTTDKVYKNNEWCWGYREDEPLDGFDPYSNSKSCSELVTDAYRNSFFTDNKGDLTLPISTARAGNVIGGGDFSADRIIPDCIKSLSSGNRIIVRNATSVRPYQHVLEPLFAYLMIIARQAEDTSISGCYNIGPEESDCISTGRLVDLICSKWGKGASWISKPESDAPHEAKFLKLDCSKLKTTFNWHPRWHIDKAVEKTVEWSKAWLAGEDVGAVMDRQIDDFIGEMEYGMEK